MPKQSPVRIPVKVRTKRPAGFPKAGPQAYRDADILVGTGMLAVKTPDGERWYPVSDVEYADPVE